MSPRALRRIVWLRLNRCSVLLVALCLMILLAPATAGERLGTTLLSVATMAVLVVGVWALRASRWTFWAVVLLALLSALAIVANRFGYPVLRPLSLAVTAVFISSVTVALLAYVLDRQPITTDKVFGAVAAYVLIAFSFASMFSLVQQFQPNAFFVNVANEPDGHDVLLLHRADLDGLRRDHAGQPHGAQPDRARAGAGRDVRRLSRRAAREPLGSEPTKDLTGQGSVERKGSSSRSLRQCACRRGISISVSTPRPRARRSAMKAVMSAWVKRLQGWCTLSGG